MDHYEPAENDPVNAPTPPAWKQRRLLESPLEIEFFDAHLESQHLELHGLVAQHKVTTRQGQRYRFDFAIPDIKIAFEMDGITYHSTREAFERDRTRDLGLELDGWAIHRFGGGLIRNDPINAVNIASHLANIRRHGTNNQNGYAHPPAHPETDPDASFRRYMLDYYRSCLTECPTLIISEKLSGTFRGGDIKRCSHQKLWHHDTTTGATTRIDPGTADHEAADTAWHINFTQMMAEPLT